MKGGRGREGGEEEEGKEEGGRGREGGWREKRMGVIQVKSGRGRG